VGLSAAHDLFVDQALGLLGSDLEVETDLPEQVEVIVGRSALGQIVHLRNLSGGAPGRPTRNRSLCIVIDSFDGVDQLPVELSHLDRCPGHPSGRPTCRARR
jgi:hypothetical protein